MLPCEKNPEEHLNKTIIFTTKNSIGIAADPEMETNRVTVRPNVLSEISL